MAQIEVPHNFIPRDYQIPVFEAFDKGIRNIDLVAHRRSGKDKISFAILAREMCTTVGGYYYVFPQFNQGRRALWDNIDNDGFKTLHHIPQELWAGINNQEMKLTLKNGSYLQVVGSDDVDRLVGTNPRGIVYSEYSLQNPIVFGYLNPIIRANGGWQVFNYTPRGQNHAKSFHDMALKTQGYASFTITVDQTNIFGKDELEAIRQDYMYLYNSDALFYQEYYCSFEKPVLGAYYGSQIQSAEQENRISKDIAYNPEFGVYTSWDLGVSDSTAIWFYQKVGNTYRFIDYYETHNAGMEHFYQVLQQKGYNYIKHYLPHDANNRVQAMDSRTFTRKDMLEQLGLRNIEIAPKIGLMDGIQKVRQIFPLCFFNAETCKRGIDCLREYHQEYSETNKAFSATPKHDWSSHGADAFRYFAVSDENEIVEKVINPNIQRQNRFSQLIESW